MFKDGNQQSQSNFSVGVGSNGVGVRTGGVSVGYGQPPISGNYGQPPSARHGQHWPQGSARHGNGGLNINFNVKKWKECFINIKLDHQSTNVLPSFN